MFIVVLFFVSLVFSQKGLDVNAELLNGRNPLHYAADYGHTDVLNYLISKGGKVDVSLPWECVLNTRFVYLTKYTHM